MADRGVGTASVALNLVLRGSRFRGDDVAAISLRNRSPTVHPVPRLTKLCAPGVGCIRGACSLLGEAIRSDHDERRPVVRGSHPDPARLRALYFLARGSTDHSPEFRERSDVLSHSLVADRFTRLLSTPDRRRRQLETYVAIAGEARPFQLSVPAGAGPRSAAIESCVRDAFG